LRRRVGVSARARGRPPGAPVKDSQETCRALLRGK